MSKNSPFSGINHLAMVTDDMDATVRFYRDVLGCRLTATIGTPRFRHYFFEIGKGNTLAFFEWPGVHPGVPEKPAGMPAPGRQFDHMSFNVETYDDLLALQQRLRDKGVEVTRVVDHQFIHSIYFDDPNGISLEASVWLMDPEHEVAYDDPDPVPAVKEQPQPAAQYRPRPLPTETRQKAEKAGVAPPDGPKPAPV
ncbi:MAG: VOC family protein [Chloroflexi bacterium]|nr:VOC family protein [Chloroflexota bacterium]